MSHAVQTEKTNVPSSAALWAVLIFIGLLVAAINFVQAESKSEGHGNHGAATEQHNGAGHEEASGEHVPAESHAPEAAVHENAAHGEHEAPAAKPAEEQAHH